MKSFSSKQYLALASITFIFILLTGALLLFSFPKSSSSPEIPAPTSLPKEPLITENPSPTSVTIPTKSETFKRCVTGGCSGELCVEKSQQGKPSICIYKEEYSCLKHSICEQQPNGSCGWTATVESQKCLQNLQTAH
jgi:eight-cysteine-cluster-containing protein